MEDVGFKGAIVAGVILLDFVVCYFAYLVFLRLLESTIIGEVVGYAILFIILFIIEIFVFAATIGVLAGIHKYG